MCVCTLNYADYLFPEIKKAKKELLKKSIEAIPIDCIKNNSEMIANCVEAFEENMIIK